MGSCEGTYGSDYLISPNYPQNHDANVDCRWLITAPVHNIITVNCSDFILKNGFLEKYADLFVYEGANVNGQLLKTVSSTTLPGLIVSTGNKLYIRLNTREVMIGFKVEIGNAGNYT